MKKICIIILILCAVGCGAIGYWLYQEAKKEEQIFEIGDIVCVKNDQEWRGPIHRITRSDNETSDVIYHIKVLCGQMKGYVVIRHKKDDLCQLIPNPR
jgi:hypothetical protein|tara:strand:- start:419 stop:712 length:294 start_codon:yes stop_codon:yes gene_type:complete